MKYAHEGETRRFLRSGSPWCALAAAVVVGGALAGCASPPASPAAPVDAMTNSGSCGSWQVGTLTGYDNSSEDDDPNAGSLVEFTGLTDAFYANVPIASVDSSDWDDDRYHFVDIRYQGTVGRVGVWDECRNEDCPDGTDCCTENKTRYASPGYLLDLETRTAKRLFGVDNAEDTLNDRIEYRRCESFDPDAIARKYGAHR